VQTFAGCGVIDTGFVRLTVPQVGNGAAQSALVAQRSVQRPPPVVGRQMPPLHSESVVQAPSASTVAPLRGGLQTRS